MQINDRRKENFEIKEIGLYYIGHFRSSCIRLCADSFGVNIPAERIPEFCMLFPDVDWENGEYLEILKGRYMRAILQGERVIGLEHITKNLTFYLGNVKVEEEK